MVRLETLGNRQVWACHVQVTDGALQCGVLVTEEDFEPGMHLLHGSDGNTYEVAIAAMAPVGYDVPLAGSVVDASV